MCTISIGPHHLLSPLAFFHCCIMVLQIWYILMRSHIIVQKTFHAQSLLQPWSECLNPWLIFLRETFKTNVFSHKTFQHTVVHSALMFLWKEMFKGFLICQIKVETLIGTEFSPVPNFLSPQHSVVRSIVSKIHQCIPHCMLNLLQHRHRNQRRTETYWTHWARQMMQCNSNLPLV